MHYCHRQRFECREVQENLCHRPLRWERRQRLAIVTTETSIRAKPDVSAGIIQYCVDSVTAQTVSLRILRE